MPEQPRFEPEIIPPGRNGDPRREDAGVFVYVDEDGNVRRKTFKAPGLLAIILALLVIGSVVAAVLLLLLGFVLIWIPVAIVLIASVMLAGPIRGFWRRLRGA